MKFNGILFLALLLLIITPSIGNAQKYAVGGGLTYATENSNAKGRIGFEGNFIFLTKSIIAIRASVGRYGSDVKVDKLSEGDYSLLWIEGTFMLQGKSPKIHPYGGLGIGYYVTGHELSLRVIDLLAHYGLRGKEDIKDILGIHLRGGLNIPVSPKVALNADLKYVFLNPSVNVELTNLSTFETISLSESVDLSILTIGFGVSITI